MRLYKLIYAFKEPNSTFEWEGGSKDNISHQWYFSEFFVRWYFPFSLYLVGLYLKTSGDVVLAHVCIIIIFDRLILDNKYFTTVVTFEIRQ